MDNSNNKSSTQYQLHAVVHGIVQGVGFRYYVLDCAEQLGIVGWVRNTYDGCVEVVAEGTHEALTNFLVDLEEGPPASDVTGVTANWNSATGLFRQFLIRSTSGYGEG